MADIKNRGMKPIINTNGKALTMELLKDLKNAGVYGFTFHIDSKQGRGDEWKGKNEIEFNQLRLKYAEMLAEVGGISCALPLHHLCVGTLHTGLSPECARDKHNVHGCHPYCSEGLPV